MNEEQGGVENSGSEGVFDPVGEIDFGQEENKGDQSEQGQQERSNEQGAQKQPSEQQQPLPFDPKEFQAGVGAAVSQALQQNNQQQQQEMSPERVDEILKRWKPNDEFSLKLHSALHDEEFKPEQVTNLVAEMRDKIMDEARTYAQLHTQYLMQQMQQQMQPTMSYVQQQQQKSSQDQFFKKYEGLKQFEKIMPAVAQSLAQQNPNFNNLPFEQQADALAKAAEQQIKQFNPQFSLEANNRGKSATPMFGAQQNQGRSKQRTSGNSASIW